MDARELRIGNLVTIDNRRSWPTLMGTPMVVTAVKATNDRQYKRSTGSVSLYHGGGKWEYHQLDEFIKPIPLTSEWLERFGFKNGKILLPERSSLDSYLIVNDGRIQICKNGYYAYDPETKYVHQLQNLYFALTGSELTLKEK